MYIKIFHIDGNKRKWNNELKKIQSTNRFKVAQMVDKKYLKEPLDEDEKGKKKRQKDEEKRKKVSGKNNYLEKNFSLKIFHIFYRTESQKMLRELLLIMSQFLKL